MENNRRYFGNANGWDFCIISVLLVALMTAGQYLLERNESKKKK